MIITGIIMIIYNLFKIIKILNKYKMTKYIIEYFNDNYNKIQENMKSISVPVYLPEFLDINHELINKSFEKKKDEKIYNQIKYVIFESHPESMDKTYKKHVGDTVYVAYNLLLTFFIFMIHAFFPIVFNKKGTEILEKNLEYSKELTNMK